MITILNEKIQNDTWRITIKNGNQICFLKFQDILFFEKQNNNVFVHTKKEIYCLKQTLTEIEAKLKDRFMRVHRSFIVNISKISKITDIGNRSYEVKFEDTDKVAFMSRYKFEEIKEEIIQPL